MNRPEIPRLEIDKPKNPRQNSLKKDMVRVFLLNIDIDKDETAVDIEDEYETKNIKIEYFDSYGSIKSFTGEEINNYCKDNNLKDYQVQVMYYVDSHHDSMVFYLQVYKDCDEDQYNKYLEDLNIYNQKAKEFDVLYKKYEEDMEKFRLWLTKRKLEKEIEEIKNKIGE